MFAFRGNEAKLCCKYLTSPKVAIITVTQKRRKMRFQEALNCEMSLQNQPTTLENMTV